jgi:anti-sigma regulatory factor (Ser/Thr protein kinase)
LTIQEDTLTLNVVDQGKQPIPQIDEIEDGGFENRLGYPRGMGMFLIKKLMDEVAVSVKPGRNEVRMVIHLEKKR